MARPRTFDETGLLDAAQELFWTRGLENTSMQDVATASGVGNGSIYAAYGSKSSLYLAVLTRYCRARVEFVARAVDGKTGSIRDGIAAYLEAVVADCIAQPHRRGCLMLNSIGVASRVVGADQLIAATTAEMEGALADRITRENTGRDASVDAKALSVLAVMLSQALIARSTLGVGEDELRHMAAACLDQCHVPS